VLPMVADGDVVPVESAGGDREAAVVFVADGLTNEVGIPEDQALCAAELMVDAMGVDNLFVDGELVDLDGLPVEVQDLAVEALTAAVTLCGIDPSLLGG